MKQIVHVPHAVLTTPAKPVTSFDKRLNRLIDELKTTFNHATDPKGVGLAAPQIGEPWRVFITKPQEKSRIRAFVNPEIIKRSDELTDDVPERDNLPRRQAGKFEGCLSIPKIWGKVKRAASLTLRYHDETGKVHEEEFKGFLATIIQHETDHIHGILFTQRILEQKGKLYQATKDRDEKEILEEITI